MNHIFYIHSNILAICCYQTVKEALAHNNKVIIITNRNCQWSFFLDKVTVYDFAEIFKGEDKERVALHSIKAIKDYMRYRRYLYHRDTVIKRIVDGNDYIFYLPTMALNMTAAFVYNKHCKGYYYVDEGSLAYLPIESANQQFDSKLRKKLKQLLKIEDHSHYEITSSFIGTISITKEAFSWNMDWVRIVNPKDECILELKTSLSSYDDVIVTTWLVEDIDLIKKSIDYTIEQILRRNRNSRIGIKIHPKAITYNMEKCMYVLQYIREMYCDRVTIISKEVSIEAMSLVYHPRLYSLFSLSSLILYGLLFQSSEGFLIRNVKDTITIVQINTVEEYNKLISKINLGQ